MLPDTVFRQAAQKATKPNQILFIYVGKFRLADRWFFELRVAVGDYGVFYVFDVVD
jgi:hypothetical protein